MTELTERARLASPMVEFLGVTFCDCAECVVGGVTQPAARFHDCQYVRERNALEAEKIAP